MTIKRIIPIALGLAMIAVASVQGYAFMMASTEVAAPEGQLDIVKLVDDLRVEVADDELGCEAKLAKLDAALENIDTVLDGGVEDERGYLVAREAIAAMRLDTPCTTQQELTALAGDFGDATIAAPMVSATPVGYTTTTAAPCNNCGGGSASGGGISGRALLLGGAAAAIAIPLASSDDDAPGAPVTP